MRDVVITGASSGIGRAVAEAFAPRRVRLFLVARRRELLQEVADRCSALGAEEVRFSPHDLSRPGEGTALIEEVLAAWGNIDLLICNAGYGYWGPMEELDPAAMRRMMEVNFHSVYESVYAVLPHMKGKGRGHLVFVGSVIGRRGMPFSAGYSASKFAVTGLAEALWGELRSAGIDVSLVCPGFTDTAFHDVASPEHRRIRPLQGQSPRKVAAAVLKAVDRRLQFVHLTFLGKLMIVSNRLSPRLTAWMMALVARSQIADKGAPVQQIRQETSGGRLDSPAVTEEETAGAGQRPKP